MKGFIKNALGAAEGLLFPARCPYCDRVIEKSIAACGDCNHSLPKEYYFRHTSGGYECCMPFLYKGIFADAAKRFKFSGRAAYSPRLAFMLVKSIKRFYSEELEEIDYVTCVPMHKKQCKSRGYNQAELLARDCALQLGLPYENLLEKFKENEVQHRLRAALREKNVRGVYRAVDAALIKDSKILIIDDIITTGSTLGECCRILKKNGCDRVICAALCDAKLR